jgi:acyl dehydratase
MIDYRKLRDWTFPVIEHTYTSDDSIRYALALGIGDNPIDEHQLKFVNDVIPGLPLAVPTMAVILGFPGSWMQDPETGIDFKKIVHGEEKVVLHRPLASSGTVVSRHRVVRIVDKGAGRGATITYEKALFDKGTGEPLATVVHTTFARGDGGFSARDGLTDKAPPAPQAVPTREPDRSCEITTLPQQALMYRLCADRNPLHSEPAVAHAAGFDRPILHGLCTYGLAARAMLSGWCDHDPRRLKSLFARFSSPVYPGETVRFEMYAEDNTVLFRAIVKERNIKVLDFGCAEIGVQYLTECVPAELPA